MLIEKVKALDSDYNFLVEPFNKGKTGSDDLSTLVGNFIDIILYVAGVLAVVYLIYSGILYITAAGNPDAAKKGQQGIINAVIGIVIIVLAFFIARAVTNFAGGATDT